MKVECRIPGQAVSVLYTILTNLVKVCSPEQLNRLAKLGSGAEGWEFIRDNIEDAHKGLKPVYLEYLQRLHDPWIDDEDHAI